MVRSVQGSRGGLNVRLPVRPQPTQVPLPPQVSAQPVPSGVPAGGVREVPDVGTPASALISLESVAPVNVEGQEHLSPVTIPDPETGIPTPQLRPVDTTPELQQRLQQEQARDTERFGLTQELPTVGADIYQDTQGTVQATRDYLTRAAQSANLTLAHSGMTDAEKKRHVSLLPVRQGGADPVEVLLNQAEIDNNQILTQGTVLNNSLPEIQQAFNIQSEEQQNALGPAIAQTFQEIASDIKTFQFEKQDVDQQSRVDEKAQPTQSKSFFAGLQEGVQKENIGKTPAQIAEEGLETFSRATLELGSQGPIRGVLNSINDSIRGKLNPGSDVSPANAIDNFTAASAVFAHWINQGWITLGTDKNGQIIPFLTEAGKLQSENSFFFRDVFNPEKRQLRKDETGFSGNLTLGTQISPYNNLYVTQQNQAFTNKGGVNLKSHALSSTAVTYLNNVFVTADPTITPFAIHMFEQVNSELQQKIAVNGGQQQQQPTEASQIFGQEGVVTSEIVPVYSESPFAEVLGQLDESSWNTYFKGFVEDGDPPNVATVKANKLISDRLNQIAKHFQRHLPILAQTPLATTINISPVTRRFFVTGSEVSYQAHSGTIRPTTTWSNVTPTIGVNATLVDSVVGKAKIIFNKGGYTGEAGGMHVIDKLHNLPNTELQILDTLLVIGATLARTKSKNNSPEATVYARENGLGNYTTWEYPDFIKFARKNLKVAAERGQQLLDLQGQVPPKDQAPWFHEELSHGKGEWQYGLGVYNSANKLYKAIQGEGPQTIYFDHQWETDSTQSNAFIMSTMMGDDKIMGLLGKFLDHGDLERGDLRISASETLTQATAGHQADVDNAFGMNPELANQWKNVLGPIFSQSWFPKAYGRGIVVAGLYGKTPWKMYKEANKFLNHGNMQPYTQQILNDYYKPKYGEDAQTKLLEDVSNLFAVSMNRHMASLTGYQTMMKNILDVLAVGGNVTEIPSLIPNELITLATEEVRPLYNKSDMLAYVSGQSDVLPQQVTTQVGQQGDTPITIGHVERDLSLASRGDRGLTDRTNLSQEAADRNSKNYYGAAARAAISPNLIQSGDTYGVITATLLANKNKGPNEVPKNLRMIHDAIISGAGSTSLALVAYNDVFPYLVQQQSHNYPTNLFETARESVIKAIQDNPDGRFVIGDSGKHRALMGYYDRHWSKLKGAKMDPEQLALLSPEERAIYEQEGFFSERLLSRMSEVTRKGVDKSIERSRKIVEFGRKNGWLPPLPSNREARTHLAVDQEGFIRLVQGMLEGNGLLDGDTPILFIDQGRGTHSNNWLTQQMKKLTGGIQRDRLGNILPTSGTQMQLADKLSKNGNSIKNMPLA